MNLQYIIPLLDRAIQLPRWQKQSIVLLCDIALLILSVWFAYSVRVGVWALWNEAVSTLMLGASGVFLGSFYVTGAYKTIFRFSGAGSVAQLARVFSVYTAGMVIIFLIVGIPPVPRTTGILQPIVFFILVLGFRALLPYLMLDLLGRSRFSGKVRNVLVYGAGATGLQLANAMRAEPEMRVCGFVDDDKRLRGQRLDDIPVSWSNDLAKVIQEQQVTDVLLAIPGATRKRRRDIVKELSDFNVEVKTLPRMRELVGGTVSINDIRPLEIDDLLGREPVTPNELLIGKTTIGKVVLVSGAGGSIGSELCRQILQAGAKKIILFEISEFALYTIEQELVRLVEPAHDAGEKIVPVLGSVTDAARLNEVFARHSVDTVFHAAAFKHVPLVEANPLQGIRNNTIGTYEMVKAAHEYGLSDFILVSTDKAVRPTNVMGASKRAAEQILQSYAESSGRTRFSMVRFGNVLGSSGSVVPLFRGQIEAGGPITVTDRRVNRYFMTIPEAASLVIQAGGLAKGGEVFVLDMGKPILIYEMAKTMVKLSGLSVRNDDNPEGDIEVVEVGLRPGEKLFEELLIGESPSTTQHARIMMAKEKFLKKDMLTVLVEELGICNDAQRALALLKEIVPEFEHMRDNDDPMANDALPAELDANSHIKNAS